MSDPVCSTTPGDTVPEHEQQHITAHLPHYVTDLLGLDSERRTFGGRVGAGTVYPCAVSGISLTDYSQGPSQKGWGAHCGGPFTTITASNGVRVTVDSRIAELATLLFNETLRRGYGIRQADTGAYNCRYISGTTVWSNHAWGLAIDINWNTNPQRSPLTTDEPAWMLQLWNRYGFAWGGNYNSPTSPDAMHHEFMGTPAQAVAATNLARSELGGSPPPSPSGGLPAKIQSPITGNMEIPGFDCSYSKPGWVEMQAAGYKYMVGYVSPTPAKNLSAANFYDYRVRAGMAVGLVWESTAGRALAGGAAGGAADAKEADRQADAIGYPTNCVIFFAVDQDTTSADYAAIQAYANAFNMNTKRPVGIYGEADVIDHFVTPGAQPVQYGWQTAAWSGGRLSAKANLYQRVGHPGWPVPAGISSSAFDEGVAITAVPLAGWQ